MFPSFGEFRGDGVDGFFTHCIVVAVKKEVNLDTGLFLTVMQRFWKPPQPEVGEFVVEATRISVGRRQLLEKLKN